MKEIQTQYILTNKYLLCIALLNLISSTFAQIIWVRIMNLSLFALLFLNAFTKKMVKV